MKLFSCGGKYCSMCASLWSAHLCCNIFLHTWIISLSHLQSHDNPILRYFRPFLEYTVKHKYCWLNSPFHLRCYGIFALARILVPPGESLIYTLGHQKSMPIANPTYMYPCRAPLSSNQTCFCQTSRMSHFGQLPDVVWPKIAQKCQK